MILSTQTDLAAQIIGFLPAVEATAKAGFDAIDISMFCNGATEEIYSDNWKELAKSMNEIVAEYGIYFNQAHAPFPTCKVNDDEYNDYIRPRIIRSIEFAGACGVKNIVIHPVFFPGNCKEKNIEMYSTLVPVAKNSGVRIAVENMWGHDNKRGYIVPNVCSVPADLADYYDTLEELYPGVFTVCLDLGHCGLVGEDPADFIRALGRNRLGALHIHDNDYKHDSHLPPFTMNQEWDRIIEALRDINYAGDFTFESDNIMKHMPPELVPACLNFLHDIGRHLIKMYERN